MRLLVGVLVGTYRPEPSFRRHEDQRQGLGGEPQDEREHFIKCRACERWIDMRDLGDLLDHARPCDGTPSRFCARDIPFIAGVERRSQLFLTDGVRASIETIVTEAQHIQRSIVFGHGR